MKSQVLHTVWCNISGEVGGEIWHWSLSGVKGLTEGKQVFRRLQLPQNSMYHHDNVTSHIIFLIWAACKIKCNHRLPIPTNDSAESHSQGLEIYIIRSFLGSYIYPSVLWDIFLVGLQGKFEIDYSWKGKGCNCQTKPTWQSPVLSQRIWLEAGPQQESCVLMSLYDTLVIVFHCPLTVLFSKQLEAVIHARDLTVKRKVLPRRWVLLQTFKPSVTHTTPTWSDTHTP